MDKSIVIAYAIPRGGSTYLGWLIKHGGFLHATKLSEHNKLHPANSSDGLLTIANLLRGFDLKFVFLDRNDEDIIKSHHAIKGFAAKKPHKTALVDAPKSKGNKSRNDILREIRSIRRNTDIQDGAKDQLGNKVNIIRLNYDNFDIEHLCKSIGGDVDAIKKAHAEAWMKKPIRHGRLSYGLK